MRRGTNGEGCHVCVFLRVFSGEASRSFRQTTRNCCACSFSASILSLFLMCLGAKNSVPFFLGFCALKKHLEQKKIACRARMALALCLPTLSPASSKGLRPDVRSRSLLSAGHSATLWAFCAFYTSILALWCAISHWDRVDSSSSFFSLDQRLDLKNSLRLSHILVEGGDGPLVCLP